MGIFDGYRLRARQREVQASLPKGPVIGNPATMRYASPWSTSNLERWTFQEWFNQDPLENTRDAAMLIPAIRRGRNRICTSAGKTPFLQMSGDVRSPEQPYWITHTGDGSTPAHRKVWTVDDLMFYGLSCWWRNNPGKDDETRQRINFDEWEIAADPDSAEQVILVNGVPAKPDEVILFTGLVEGVLTNGRECISDTRRLYQIVRDRLQNPAPLIELHQKEGADLTDEEIDKLIQRWADARSGKNAGVAYTSKHIEALEKGAGGDASLMIESRNAAAVDAARLLNLHAGSVDATTPKSSLDYTTQTGRNEEFVDFDLDLYTLPITARLSEDDVCAPGLRIVDDLTDFISLTPSPTGPALED